MSKRVLDVGNCNMDHSSIRELVTGFGAEIVRAHGMADALTALGKQTFDLVLVNRLMDRSGEPGLEIIEEIKRNPDTSATPVMMITNYREHQQKAVDHGAEPGFGKKDLHSEETRQKLARFLA
jgi:CheY-like chemotaxis protein